MVLLPGTLCDDRIFHHQIDGLAAIAPKVDAVVFQQENSISEMAETVIRHAATSGCIALAGFSMGGMVALEVARRKPDLVEKLALINSNCHTEIPQRHQARLQHLALARQCGIGEMITGQYLSRYLHRQQVNHRQLIVEMAEQLGVDVFEAQLQALATRPDNRNELKELGCPALILGSEFDQLCPPATQIEMHRLAPCSDLVILEDCGHFSTLERPDAVTGELAKWYLQSPYIR